MSSKKDIPFKTSELKKTQGVYCCAYACTNDPVPKKGGLCHKHYARKLRETDPVYMRYNQFKCSATQRVKDFSITLEQFRKFCNDTGYIVKKGMRGLNARIDRININEGYHIDNIQILSVSENSIKWHEVDKHQLEEVPF